MPILIFSQGANFGHHPLSGVHCWQVRMHLSRITKPYTLSDAICGEPFWSLMSILIEAYTIESSIPKTKN